MVIKPRHSAKQSGLLMVELAMAVAILTVAVAPLAYGFHSEVSLLRETYQRTVAMEIVDGEAEILAATDERNFPEGTSVYPVTARAVASLPPGQFQLTRHANHLRLQWTSATKSGVGPVVRDIHLK